MEGQNIKKNKHIYLSQLYKKMDEKERKSLVGIADKLLKVQSSIGNTKVGLQIEANKQDDLIAKI